MVVSFFHLDINFKKPKWSAWSFDIHHWPFEFKRFTVLYKKKVIERKYFFLFLPTVYALLEALIYDEVEDDKKQFGKEVDITVTASSKSNIHWWNLWEPVYDQCNSLVTLTKTIRINFYNKQRATNQYICQFNIYQKKFKRPNYGFRASEWIKSFQCIDGNKSKKNTRTADD